MKKSVSVAVLACVCLAASLALLQAQGPPEPADAAAQPDRTFIIHFCTRDIGEFAKVAGLAEILKPHGHVEFNVSTLAEKSAYDVPKGGSPWHEYASYAPAPYKYFPPKRLAPFIPAEHVAKNRQMLEAKMAILRRRGFGASFSAYVPNFWPEAFYEAYPHLRGARSDHPRRSRKEAFSPCVDRPEVLSMIAESMEQLVEAVPELVTYSFKTNDAGPGICWSYWLYSGPNGPTECKDRGMGHRVRGMLDAMNRGAERAGGKLDISMSGLFSDEERADIRANLPENVTFGWSRRRASVGTGVNSFYPVKGIINPVAMLGRVARLSQPQVKKVFVTFRVSYDRGGELPETVAKVFEMIDDALRDPIDRTERLKRLRKLCAKWGGPEHADRLYDALVDLDEAFKYRRETFGGFRSLYTVVSTRHINRPLVAMPDKLLPEEEAYFLPHVFNKYVNEGRMDYIDIHGRRMILTPTGPERRDPRIGEVNRYRGRLHRVCDTLESLRGAPEEEFFRKMALSLRMHASMMRSVNNFHAMQIVRDRNREKLTGKPRIPSKLPTREGDPDLLMMNAYMRDELDNTQELIDLLKAGGMDRITHAKTNADEDTFLLGPDLIEQLKKKRAIMRRHWLDAEDYMTTPFK